MNLQVVVSEPRDSWPKADGFFIDGDPTVGFFVRDSTGTVSTELVHFLGGRLVAAHRIP